MKNKWILNIGAILLAVGLMAGCGTMKDDNDMDPKENDAPIQDDEQDENLNEPFDEDNNDNDLNEDRNDREDDVDLNEDRDNPDPDEANR